MEATIHLTGKKVVKVLGAACLATGVVALSAVIASGAAVGAVAEGFRSAKNTMQKILKKDGIKAEDGVPEESPNETMAAKTVGEIHETAADEVLAESSNIIEATAEES